MSLGYILTFRQFFRYPIPPHFVYGGRFCGQKSSASFPSSSLPKVRRYQQGQEDEEVGSLSLLLQKKPGGYDKGRILPVLEKYLCREIYQSWFSVSKFQSFPETLLLKTWLLFQDCLGPPLAQGGMSAGRLKSVFPRPLPRPSDRSLPRRSVISKSAEYVGPVEPRGPAIPHHRICIVGNLL